jgi:hypothetical protein
MDEAALEAAEEEAEAYERDRRMTDDYRWSEEAHTFDDSEEEAFRTGPPSVARQKGYFDDVKPGAMSGDWKKDDPIGAILYEAGNRQEEKTSGTEPWPAHVAERFRQIYDSLHADKNYPAEFNKWYFLNVEQHYEDEGTHGPNDYRKKEAYAKWKAARWRNFYGSQVVEGVPDEVSDAWQDLDRAYDDGNGMFVDPAAVNMVDQLKTFKVRGTVTGRVSGTHWVPPHVSWGTAKKQREKPKVSKKQELEQSLAALRQRLAELHDQYETILQRPNEPMESYIYRGDTGEEDPIRIPPAVYFKKQFTDQSWQGGKRYDYTFMKAGNGFWYGTGPHAPQKQTWDQLMDWIDTTGPWPVIFELNPLDGQTGVYWRPREEGDE